MLPTQTRPVYGYPRPHYGYPQALKQMYSWRNPRSMSMTIALGILTPDAVVIGADTEQTWGYLKTSGTKVFTKEAHGAIAVTGSGTTGYIEAFSQELQS